MRKIYTLALLFMLFSLAAGAQISGKVLDKTDKTPLNAATVSLLRIADSTEAGKTVTDPTGAFSFPAQPAGRYLIRIEALNYQESVAVVTASDTAATAV